MEDFTYDTIYPAYMVEDMLREYPQNPRYVELQMEQKSLINDLYAAGYKLESVWNFVNTQRLYLGALPVLLKHVQLPYSKRIKEGIVRALMVKEFRGTEAGRIVLDEYKKLEDASRNNGLTYVYLAVIQCLADKSIKEDLEAMLEDPKYESVRADIEKAIRKAKRK